MPVYVRATGDASKGLDALRKGSALPWPNPRDAEGLEAALTPPGNPHAGGASRPSFHDPVQVQLFGASGQGDEE